MKTVWLSICLVLGMVLAWFGVQPPPPVSADAPSDRFSAARAFSDIRVIAEKPHPVGSRAHDAVKTYLTKRFSEMGFRPEVWNGVGIMAGQRNFARVAPVTDIVAVLPGRDPKLPAVAVMSHYDTVTHSPGAADDTAGVASLLEIARALKAGPQPQRDVVFLVTDGEELGLLGAQAFFAHHPLADHIGAVVNFEARGDAGLTAMFETGAGNAGYIALLAGHARLPSATSLAGAIYGSMPNGSDFSIVKKHGINGLNFAFIGDESAYHSPLATPAHLSLGSVQHMGDQALPVVRALAMSADLPKASGDAVYADLFALVLIQYPPWVGWILLAAVAGLLAWGWRAGGTRLGLPTACAFVGAVLTVLVPALLLWLAGKPFDAFGHFQLVPYFPVLLAAALVLIPAAVFPTLFILRRGRGWRALRAADLWHGALALGLALAVALQILLPVATPIVLWPLLVAAGLFAATGGKTEGRRFVWLGGIAAILVLGWVGASGEVLFEAMGLTYPWLLAVPLLAALPVLMPLAAVAAEEKALPISGALLLIVGVSLVLYARFAPPGEVRPMPSAVLHVQDFDANKAWRVAGFLRLDPWAEDALRSGGGMPRQVTFAGMDRPLWAAPVEPVSMPRPNLRIAREGGRLVIVADGHPGDHLLTLSLRSSAELGDAQVNGLKAEGRVKAGDWSDVDFYAPDRPLTWSFAAPAHAKIEVVVRETRAAWPAGAAPLPAMPKTYMPMSLSGYSQGMISKTFAW